MRKKRVLGSLILAVVMGAALGFCVLPCFAEDITITTYYPAPMGVYNELRAKKMGIGDTYHDPSAVTINDPDDLIVEGNVGIGTSNPAYQLELSLNSAAKPAGGAWTNPSDRRLKKDIIPFTDGLGVITKINPVRYRLNGKAGTPKDTEGISVIAQDIKDIAPYTVSTYKAKLEIEDEEETELYNFDSSPLTFVMINAIKQLKQENEKLRKRIEILENR